MLVKGLFPYYVIQLWWFRDPARPQLGRTGSNRRFLNLGIAKRGGGVSPVPRFFGGFEKVNRGQPKVIMALPKFPFT